jgi:membrane associated rhomboid family serine protease
VLLASELSTGHEIGLIVVAAVLITFALLASFVAPRIKPDFPGPNGIGPFVIASVVLFALMVAAVNFFG